jgi:RND family efflux transporter MFP subunit
MDGQVLREDGEVGEIVGTTDVLYWVGRPSPLQIVAEVNEEDVPQIAPGQPVLLRNDGFPDEALRATVNSITPKGDPVNKVFRAYLGLPGDTPLRIGMSVEANIVVETRGDTLVVPSEAVLDGAVFAVVDGRLEHRPVQFGLRGLRKVELIAGVREGERVVVPASPELSAGQRVTISGAGG